MARAGAAAPAPVVFVTNPTKTDITGYPLPSTGNQQPSVTITTTAHLDSAGLAIDAHGNLWASTSTVGADRRVHRCPDLHRRHTDPGSCGSGLTQPSGLAFDGSGDLSGHRGEPEQGSSSSSRPSWRPAGARHRWSAIGRDAATPPSLSAPGPGGLRPRRPLGEQHRWEDSGRVHPGPAGSRRYADPHVTITSDATHSFVDPAGINFDAHGDLWVGNWDSADDGRVHAIRAGVERGPGTGQDGHILHSVADRLRRRRQPVDDPSPGRVDGFTPSELAIGGAVSADLCHHRRRNRVDTARGPGPGHPAHRHLGHTLGWLAQEHRGGPWHRVHLGHHREVRHHAQPPQ